MQMNTLSNSSHAVGYLRSLLRLCVGAAWTTVYGVICVKFNMHNISNMSVAFIEQTMPTCMHNMPMFMHNMPSCKHNMPSCMHNMHLQYTNMHAQYNIMQAQHTIKHVCTKINPNMTYAHTTCQHASQYHHVICTAVDLSRSTFQSSNLIGQYIIHDYMRAHMCRCPNNTLN